MLAHMYTALGNATGASLWNARSAALAAAIQELWDPEDGAYYYAAVDSASPEGRQFRRIQTPEIFAPLLLNGVPDDRVARLVSHLSNKSTFDLAVPSPTVAADEHGYSTDMWRGAMWLNTNWFTILGLRNYPHVPGALEAANKLQQAAVAAVAQGYRDFGTSFEFYDSANSTPPTQLARKGKHCGGALALCVPPSCFRCICLFASAHLTAHTCQECGTTTGRPHSRFGCCTTKMERCQRWVATKAQIRLVSQTGLMRSPPH